MKKYVFMFVIAIVLSIFMLPFLNSEEIEERSNADILNNLLNPENNPLVTATSEEDGNDSDTSNDSNNSNIYVKPIPNAVGEPKVEPIPNAKEGDYEVIPLPNIFKESEGELVNESIGGL